VRLDGVCAVVAAERHVEELGALPDLAEAGADVRLKVVPPGGRCYHFLKIFRQKNLAILT
jgi:hypothetical protein